MKYNGIKKILRDQIQSKTQALWTWDKEDKNFTWIYKNYTDDLPIYTPSQLLEEIEKEIKLQVS